MYCHFDPQCLLTFHLAVCTFPSSISCLPIPVLPGTIPSVWGTVGAVRLMRVSKEWLILDWVTFINRNFEKMIATFYWHPQWFLVSHLDACHIRDSLCPVDGRWGDPHVPWKPFNCLLWIFWNRSWLDGVIDTHIATVCINGCWHFDNLIYIYVCVYAYIHTCDMG